MNKCTCGNNHVVLRSHPYVTFINKKGNFVKVLNPTLIHCLKCDGVDYANLLNTFYMEDYAYNLPEDIREIEWEDFLEYTNK